MNITHRLTYTRLASLIADAGTPKGNEYKDGRVWFYEYIVTCDGVDYSFRYYTGDCMWGYSTIYIYLATCPDPENYVFKITEENVSKDDNNGLTPNKHIEYNMPTYLKHHLLKEWLS